MAGYYTADRDPRLSNEEDESCRFQECARKRQRTGSIVKSEVEVPMKPADRISQDSDRTIPGVEVAVPENMRSLQMRIIQLETHISALHKDNAALTAGKAQLAKERCHSHKRVTDLTEQHAGVVSSHAKRVEEKQKLLEENAALLEDNAALRSENAAYVESLVEKDRRIEELEGEKDELMSARQEDELEVRRVMGERDELKRVLERACRVAPAGWKGDDIRADWKDNDVRAEGKNDDAQRGYIDEDRGRIQSRSNFHRSSAEVQEDFCDGERDRDRGRSTYRDYEVKQEYNHGRQSNYPVNEPNHDYDHAKRGRERARSTYRDQESHDFHDEARIVERARQSYRGDPRRFDPERALAKYREYYPPSRREHSRPPSVGQRILGLRQRPSSPSAWEGFRDGVQPPTGPKGEMRD